MPPTAVASIAAASGHRPTFPRYATTGTTRSPSFNEDTENYHRVEFEAPVSAEADSEENRLQKAQESRFSIDYSLDLERELAMESPPDTPAHHETAHPATSSSFPSLHARTASRATGDVSPDPEVLAHIITQLNLSLADMTKERDELLEMLATASTEEANAKDALQGMTDRATAAEEELSLLRRKTKEDEDQITLLRTKVEESRRGLMRLQTENRRSSMAPIDVSRASAGNFSSFTSPPSSKRASFVPLTGSGKSSGHRRNGSVNDIGLGAFPAPDQNPSPNMRAFNIASAEASLSGGPSSSRRFSGLFGRAPSPLDGEVLPSAAAAAEPSANVLELETLKKELQAIKDQLDVAKHELNEANEAKEASETCVVALREFIAENNVGVNGPATGVKLPPPPSMTTGEESSTESKKTGSGWGFKLWGNGATDPAVKSGIGNAPHSAVPVSSSPMVGYANVPPPSATTPAAPFSRKIGGFFGSRSSISSTTSPSQPPALNLQTNAAANQRDSMYSHSDVSSIAEPISPGSDINGLGTATYQSKTQAARQEEVLVKDLDNLEGGSMHVSMSGSDLELR